MTARMKLPALILFSGILAFIGLVSMNDGPGAQASAGSLINPGFEEGILHGSPKDWTVESEPDVVVVIGSEGPAEVPIYGDLGNITVVPYMGDLMLRIGSPKKVSEKQPSGQNTVSQSFVPSSDTLRFSFRLFSWEHRGNDLFAFDITDAIGSSVGSLTSPVSVAMEDGTELFTCTALPCQSTIDVGKRGRFLDSGWQEVGISGLAGAGEVTLSYTVAGTGNSAHATWGYFDNVSAAPVAKFSFLPEDPQEGAIIQLIDLSYDTDPDDSVVSWLWQIQGPGMDPVSSTAQTPNFIPADDGTYSVSLTVADTDGLSTTVAAGEVAADAEMVPPLVVNNASPLPNALNVEVLEGDDLALTGRFLDPGWLDTHTAQWDVATGYQQIGGTEEEPEIEVLSTVIPGEVQEDHTPALGTGIIGGTISAANLSGLDAGSIVGGVLQVTDNAGGYRNDVFAVKIIADDPQRHEDNDTIDSAVTLVSDSAYLSYIQDKGDVDVFQVKWPGAATDADNNPILIDPQELPPGTEVLVTLDKLPSDYDLIVVTKQPPTAPFQLSPFQLSPFQLSPFQLSPFQLSPFQLSPFQLSPFQLSPFQLSPFQLSPFQLSPFQLSPFQLSPFQLSPFQLSPFQLSPFQLSPFQLSPFQLSPFQLSPFQLSPFQLSPFQISPFQLSPFQLSPFQLSPLSTMSFNGVDGDEISGTDIDFAELGLGDIVSGNVKIAGFSANRGTEAETVLIRVDAPGTQVFVVVVGSNEAYSLSPYSLQIEASIPFDQAVLAADLDPELYPELAAICGGEPRVQGSYPLTTLKGDSALDGDDIPLTLIVTQRERFISMYGQSAWDDTLAKLTELADHQAVDGKIISLPSSIYDVWDTDTCSVPNANTVSDAIRTEILSQLDVNATIRYVVLTGDDDIVPFRRVPDETTISSERYYLMGSFLKAGSPLFASIQQGYNLTDDFYVDIQPSPWQGRALYVPDRAIGRLVETPGEIRAAAQAFLDSNGQLDPDTAFVSGYDFFTDGSLKMAEELSAVLSTNALINDSWSIEDLRCQYLGVSDGDPACVISGVNAVNAHYTHYAAVSAGGYNGANGLDLTDYISSAEVAGSPESLAGTIVYTMGCHAGLNVPDWSAIAADPGLGIDPALDFVQAMARQRAIYIASTGYGLGDDEGLGGTERLLAIFSGELVQGDVVAGGALVTAKQRYLNSLSTMTVYDEKSSIQTTFYGMPQYTVLPIVVESTSQATEQASVDTAQIAPVLTEIVTTDGSYYTADGDAQSTAGRPIQPRVVIDLDTDPINGPVHGALILGNSFQDIEPFDPVITRPTTEWESDTAEPQTCLPSHWPSELATVNSLETADGLIQSLVVVPGQFRCTSGEVSPITGTQRIYESTTLELLRSTSLDFGAPAVGGLDIQPAAGAEIEFTIDAGDPSGIERIVVLRINSTTGQTSVAADVTTTDPSAGSFTVAIPAPGDDALLIQVVDGAGNVATATGKGANLTVITVITEPDVSVNENTELWLNATVDNFETLTPPVSYIWEFGDGIFATGQTSNGQISVSHVYPDDDPTGTPSDQYETTLKVTDAAGGIGNAATTVTVVNVVPDVVILTTVSPIDEDGYSTVTGEFTDISNLDTHTATIDWGDGTVGPLPIVQSAGSGTFAGSHQYLDDDPSGTESDVYTVTVTVTDDDTGSGIAQAPIVVNNLSPTVDAGPDQTATEGAVVSLVGVLFNDVGTLDTHSATIDWGDGSAIDAGVVAPSPEGPSGVTSGTNGSVAGSHVYADDGLYIVTVTVIDDDSTLTSDTFNVAIGNVAPTIDAGADQTATEGAVVSLAPVTFNDLGTLDIHATNIDWGDGTGPEAGSVSEIPFGPPGSTAGADGTISGSHVYADDGVYTVTVTVADDDGGVATDSLAITVYNVAPTVDASADQVTTEGSVVSLAPAIFNDLGTLDTHTATINWGDGTVPDLGVVSEAPFGPPGSTGGASGTISGSHVYADDGVYTVTITVVDDDGGIVIDSLAVTVNNVAPTVVTGLDQSTAEGSLVSLAPATFNDLGTLDTHTATIDWGDGSVPDVGVISESPFGPPGSTAGADGTVSASHVYADNGVYTVTVTVIDNDGGTGSDMLLVTIDNAAPTVDAGEDQITTAGTLLSLVSAGFNDLGTLDAHTATVDWGDGTVADTGTIIEAPFGPPGSTAGASGTIAGGHVYAANGAYTVTVTVTDDDGGSASDTMVVAVIGVDAGIDQNFADGFDTTLRATVTGFGGTTVPVTFLWDFGDGSSLGGSLDAGNPDISEFSIADDNLTFSVQHQYSTADGPPFTATLSITNAVGVSDEVLVSECGDPVDAADVDGDLITCGVSNDYTTMTIVLGVVGTVDSDFQYRIRLDTGSDLSPEPDGLWDVALRYRRGKAHGLPGLTVTPISDNQLAFTFGLNRIDRDGGDKFFPVLWFAETQAGIKAKETGWADRMPDTGFLSYVLR